MRAFFTAFTLHVLVSKLELGNAHSGSSASRPRKLSLTSGFPWFHSEMESHHRSKLPGIFLAQSITIANPTLLGEHY